jgi:hypothetical protein
MTVSVEKVERELKISREDLLREGVRRFLEFELRRVSAEKAAICVRHSVTSFDELWGKLEKGDVEESACWEDLTRLEFLELRSDKVVNLLKEHTGA